MKTKKLIELLLEVDPTGEVEVCVDNVDIFDVEKLPAYHDGSFQVLIRDDSKEYYNITGGRLVCSGQKIQITSFSIKDGLYNAMDGGEFNIEIIGSNSELERKKIDGWINGFRQHEDLMISTENKKRQKGRVKINVKKL